MKRNLIDIKWYVVLSLETLANGNDLMILAHLLIVDSQRLYR